LQTSAHETGPVPVFSLLGHNTVHLSSLTGAAMDERAEISKILKGAAEHGRKMRDALRTLDMTQVIKSGILIPKGRGRWYEVPGNIHDLPDGIGYLIEEAKSGNSKSGKRPMIKLARVGPLLKTLEKFPP
jgi:hypothetical protein